MKRGFSLTYIYHDCFVAETASAVMIFDYWKDPRSKGHDKDFPPLLDEIDPSKKLYVIVSHHHKDHFTRRIFLWAQKFPDISYIISRDVFKAVRYMLSSGGNYDGYRPPEGSVHVLEPGESYEDNCIFVKAYGSTDIGNSYVVESEGYRLFHAGDLNAWIWLDESTEEEVRESKRDFSEILDNIASDYTGFDAVMFPVDSRMGREYWWGAKIFCLRFSFGVFVPMHFELVTEENEKEQRRIDAAAFKSFAREGKGEYLQLAGTRSRYLSFREGSVGYHV